MLVRLLYLLSAALGIYCFTITAPQHLPAPTVNKEIEAASRDGKAVILIIAPSSRKQNDTSEAYGDWSDGVNDFVATVSTHVKIFKLTRLSLSYLLAQPKIANNFALLFIRDSEHALVYDGVAVEPKIYKLGLEYLNHEPDERSNAEYGLKEKAIHFR